MAAVKGLYAIVDPEHCAGRDARLVAEGLPRIDESAACVELEVRVRSVVAAKRAADTQAAYLPFLKIIAEAATGKKAQGIGP